MNETAASILPLLEDISILFYWGSENSPEARWSVFHFITWLHKAVRDFTCSAKLHEWWSECVPSIFPPQVFMPVLIGWNEIDAPQVEKCFLIAWILSPAWMKCCWKLFKRLSAGSKLTVSTDGASQPFPSWVVLHSDDIHSITLSHGQIQRPFAAPVVPHSCNVKHLRLSFQLERLRNGGRVELPAVWNVFFLCCSSSQPKNTTSYWLFRRWCDWVV